MRASAAPTGADHADPVVARVDDVEVAGRVDGQGTGLAELRRHRRPPVAAEALLGGSGDGAHDAVGRYLLHNVVGLVGEEEVAVAVYDDAVETGEGGLPSRRSIGRKSGLAVAGDGVDGARGVDASYAMCVDGVKGSAALVERQAPDALEHGFGRGAAVAREPFLARPGDGVHHAVASEPLDGGAVGDVDVAGPVD